MKKRTLPLLLSMAMAPAAFSAIYLDGQNISSEVTITSQGGDIYIATAGGGDTGGGDTGGGETGGGDTGGGDTGGGVTEPTPPPPVDNGSCSAESQELVVETLDWANQGPKELLKTGGTTVSTKFTTTSSSAYAGYIAISPVTSTYGVTRRVWISNCPNGEPLEAACEKLGAESKLTWTQGNLGYCDLNRNQTYYINYRNLDGSGSTYRTFRNNGKP